MNGHAPPLRLTLRCGRHVLVEAALQEPARPRRVVPDGTGPFVDNQKEGEDGR
jgi:hypothetical protein